MFITSNETVSVEKCFGLKLDGKYYFVPFTGYLNPAIQGIVINADLNGQSQRPTLAVSVTDLDDHEKMIRLMRIPQSTRSVGIMVTSEAYHAHERELDTVEFMPGFDNKLLTNIRLTLKKQGVLGSNHDSLTEIQKKWLYQFFHKYYEISSNACIAIEEFENSSEACIAIKRFENSSCNVIAAELLRQPKDWKDREVDGDCVEQLLRVINYAHDHGGKKIIVVNATGFTQQELITQIKMHIDERDKERTIARLDQLFYSSELVHHLPI